MRKYIPLIALIAKATLPTDIIAVVKEVVIELFPPTPSPPLKLFMTVMVPALIVFYL